MKTCGEAEVQLHSYIILYMFLIKPLAYFGEIRFSAMLWRLNKNFARFNQQDFALVKNPFMTCK
jgi:hypothetical protein